MKTLYIAIAVLALSACSTVAPNDAPVQATNGLGFGGIKATGAIQYGAIPVMSGNFAAIPDGQPGDGGSAQ